MPGIGFGPPAHGPHERISNAPLKRRKAQDSTRTWYNWQLLRQATRRLWTAERRIRPVRP